jgi:putative transposase
MHGTATRETVTITEIAKVKAITRQAADKRAKKEKWAFELRPRNAKLYYIDSLPEDVRMEIIPSMTDDIISEITALSTEQPFECRLPVRQAQSDPLLSEWYKRSESCRDAAVKILGIVNKARSIKAKAKKGKTKALQRFAESQGMNWKTLYRYLKKAEDVITIAQAEGGDIILAQVMALTPKFGQSKGICSAFSDKALSYAKKLYLSQKHLNVSDVFKQTVNEANIQGWNTGSYDTLNRILNEMDEGLKVKSRKGKKRYQADCQYKILRDYREIWPNFMWCGDHHIFDVFVKAPGGKVLRPWVTAWLDMASRSFIGWCVSFQPNSRTIALALAHGISRKDDVNFPQHGLPLSVYIDNGKDYRCKYLNGEEIKIGQIDYPAIMEKFSALGIDPYYIDLEYDPDEDAWVKKRGSISHTVQSVRVGGVYARLNIHQRYATAYHPWAKPIERAFRNVVQQFSRDLPGWCGSGHEQRPEKLTFEIKRGLLLDYDDFCNRFYNYIVYDYNKASHSGHGMDGRSPDEVFLSYGQPKIIDNELLSFALLKKENVKIHNWGFNLNGSECELDIPADLTGAAILQRLINRYVTVLHDPDHKMIRVYLNGEYVCSGKRLLRASFIRPDDQVMVDKLKLQSYQDRLVNMSIKRIQDESPLELGMSETDALLSLTNDAEDMPSYEENTETGYAASSKVTRIHNEPVPLVEEERYRMILRKEAEEKELSDADRLWKEEYQQTEEYRDRAQLYQAEFDYMKHQYEREANA